MLPWIKDDAEQKDIKKINKKVQLFLLNGPPEQ